MQRDSGSARAGTTNVGSLAISCVTNPSLVENASTVSIEGAKVRHTRNVTVDPRSTIRLPETSSKETGLAGTVGVAAMVALTVGVSVVMAVAVVVGGWVGGTEVTIGLLEGEAVAVS